MGKKPDFVTSIIHRDVEAKEMVDSLGGVAADREAMARLGKKQEFRVCILRLADMLHCAETDESAACVPYGDAPELHGHFYGVMGIRPLV